MLIDNITLGVFEDSGWYRVNYTAADNFIWGQGICVFVFFSVFKHLAHFCNAPMV